MMRKKNTQAVKITPHIYLRTRSLFGTGYRTTPPPKETEKDQWVLGGLQA
jgi:hypothetical protein